MIKEIRLSYDRDGQDKDLIALMLQEEAAIDRLNKLEDKKEDEEKKAKAKK